MGLRINTNLASLAAQRQISLTQRNSDGALRALASGNRFDDPNESGADFSISEHLRAQIAGLKAAQNNAENAQGFIQVAESGLNEQNNLLIRMRELSVQAASDNFSDTEREFMNTEFQELKKEVDRIALSTQYGSQKLLAGQNKEFDFQVGTNKGPENVIKFKSEADTRAGELGVDSLDVADQDEALDSLESIDQALEKIAGARSSLGAVDSRLNSTISHVSALSYGISQARSQIADTDVAKASSEMVRARVLQQYQAAVLAQANEMPGLSLKLIA
jgi:flagellin